jgi:hypothetical protein
MDPLTAGLITGGMGIFQSFMGQNQAREAAAQRNRQRKQEWRQRLAIRNTEWNQQVKAYKLRVQGYEQGLKNRAKMTALDLTQDELNLNQMMKGMRFASQDASIAQSQALGKQQASAQTGRTAGRKMVMTVGAFGRNQAKREERMLGEIYSKNLKAEARVASLDAQNQAAHAQVAYAPEYGAPSIRPTMESGPSSFSLLSGIGGAALSGFNAYQSQSNFRQGLMTTNFNRG